MIFNEDKSKIRELQAARNLSLLYTIIMNVYWSFGFDSIKQGIYWSGNIAILNKDETFFFAEIFS